MKGIRICRNGKPWGHNRNYHNPEYIRKQRETHLGIKNGNWKGGITKQHMEKYATRSDYLFSAENMNRIRVTGMRSKKGMDNPMFGRKHSEGTRLLMSQKKIGIFDGPGNPNWCGGISFEPYGQEFDDQLKEQVRKRDNHKCQLCFIHQNEMRNRTNRSYKLIVHHIDYDKTNNTPENLISLCRKCHIKTNYKRQKWTIHLKDKINGGFTRGRV
ncbi:MAG: HNH endonuclease [Nanoarchaeota archaeon]|nr:HNH endonuclease [Nanoarchaeota archaeon]